MKIKHGMVKWHKNKWAN